MHGLGCGLGSDLDLGFGSDLGFALATCQLLIASSRLS
jgi:hypothetical protein